MKCWWKAYSLNTLNDLTSGLFLLHDKLQKAKVNKYFESFGRCFKIAVCIITKENLFWIWKKQTNKQTYWTSEKYLNLRRMTHWRFLSNFVGFLFILILLPGRITKDKSCLPHRYHSSLFLYLIYNRHSFLSNAAAAAAAAKLLQSCPTLCDPIDSSPPDSPVPGILQARVLEWVAISFSNACKWKVKVKLLSRVRVLATPRTAAYQAPPSMGFSRQEYWSGVPPYIASTWGNSQG